jgi:hypothetical protein
MMGSCKQSKEHSDFLKGDKLSNHQLLKKGSATWILSLCLFFILSWLISILFIRRIYTITVKVR